MLDIAPLYILILFYITSTCVYFLLHLYCIMWFFVNQIIPILNNYTQKCLTYFLSRMHVSVLVWTCLLYVPYLFIIPRFKTVPILSLIFWLQTQFGVGPDGLSARFTCFSPQCYSTMNLHRKMQIQQRSLTVFNRISFSVF